MSRRSDRKVLLLLTGGFTLVIGLLVAADRTALSAMQTFEQLSSAAVRAELSRGIDAVQAIQDLETLEHFNFSDQFGRARGLLMIALLLAVAVAGATVVLASRLFRRVEWQGEELAQLSARTLETQEATVRRFSRELHDQFGQTLSALEANLVALDARQQPHEIRGRIEDCIGLVQDVISQAREMSQLLRPSILDDFGLSASLEWLAEGVAQRTGLRVRYSSTFTGRVADDIETHLFRIAQEALTNSVRHASAANVEMILATESSDLTLTVTDDGRGVVMPPQVPRGLGLVGMRERARQVGGDLIIRSEPSHGTTIVARVPISAPASVHVA